ncbi:hypothetical protein N2152v2_002915 [Parachlorella kessleri]
MSSLVVLQLGAPGCSHLGRQSHAPPTRKGRRSAAIGRHFQPCFAIAQTDRGKSGLDIEGNRPTSPKAWEAMSTTLKSKGLKFVAPQEVANAQQRGIPVIDVRPKEDFAKGRVPDAANVQFYQLISGWSARQIWRRAGFAFFGVFNGTEANPDFLEQVEQAAPDKSAGVILVCNVGGTLDPTGPSKFGRQTRSLMAAFELIQAGWSNVQVLKGGFNEWAKSGRDVESDEE